ncbi:hypothetical protein EK21DRAFT_94789 [Setomelanomma holmii]|uniref:Uncharacterized protein n=1 Tax=Setomelanomma holmii TaxID=210430 RepID=A0A9P4GX32_9PLEO|nr:hypothetical protein EK21DRAFT_94789 [Setomelanomma holmii]
MLSFLTTFAASSYVSQLLADTPWTKLVAFLNTLVKTKIQIQNQNQAQNIITPQDINTLFSTPVFSEDGERSDELQLLANAASPLQAPCAGVKPQSLATVPLPEDHLVRGLIWAHDYFPKKWFEREHDEEERYLELASTVRSRMQRVLRLGHKLSSYNRWISYDSESRTFSVVTHTAALG